MIPHPDKTEWWQSSHGSHITSLFHKARQLSNTISKKAQLTLQSISESRLLIKSQNTWPHTVMSALRIISLSDLQILISLKVFPPNVSHASSTVSSLLFFQLHPAQCINPSAATVTLVSVKSVVANPDFFFLQSL